MLGVFLAIFLEIGNTKTKTNNYERKR